MKKTIKLTESELMSLVKRVINERMESNEDLINATYNLMYDLYEKDYADNLYIDDLFEAAKILEDELFLGDHGPVMDEKIEDLLTRIEAVIGYSDDEEGEDIEDHL